MTDARLRKPPEANNQAGITEITAAKSVLLTGHMAHHPQAFPKLHTLYINKSAFPHDWSVSCRMTRTGSFFWTLSHPWHSPDM